MNALDGPTMHHPTTVTSNSLILVSLSHTQNIYDDSLQLLKSVGFGVETVRYTGTLVRDRSLGTMIDRLFVTVVSSSCTHPRLLDGWRCFSGVDQDDTTERQSTSSCC